MENRPRRRPGRSLANDWIEARTFVGADTDWRREHLARAALSKSGRAT